ncbi:MAG: carbohydrate ABC transporter permease [Candidatus Humimicrobiaceae bacterium]
MKRKINAAKINTKLSYYAANVLLIISVIFIFIPIIWMISTSLKGNAELFKFPPSIIPLNPTLDSYKDLFVSENKYFLYFRNSILVSVSATFLCLLVSVFAGYGLSRFKFKAKPGLLIYFLITQMFPFSLVLLTLYLFFAKIHLLNNSMGLIIVFISISLAFSIWMLKNYFDTIPKELEEAAYIDGATRTGSLFRVILPIIGPGVIATGIFVFITSWNEYLFAYTLSTSETVRTLPPGLALSYMNFMKITWNGLMAASVVAALPSVIVFAFLQKWFIQGLAAGAVKG